MYQELVQFKILLKCQYSNSIASVHYSSDLTLFFSYVGNMPAKIMPSDVERYVSNSQKKNHRPATINRRLSALRTFYYVPFMTCDQPPACPVLPRHRLRKSYSLPQEKWLLSQRKKLGSVTKSLLG